MRSLIALAGLTLLAFAPGATAAPVSLAPISYSPEFQQTLDDDLGAREGDVLSRAVTAAVSRALEARGAEIGPGSGLTLEVSIVDADPNRPTFAQLGATPGLDAMRSISLGGAELRGVLRGTDGQIISEVTHRRYDYNIEDVTGFTTWSSAQRAIRQFAAKVADAYVAAENQ